MFQWIHDCTPLGRALGAWHSLKIPEIMKHLWGHVAHPFRGESWAHERKRNLARPLSPSDTAVQLSSSLGLFSIWNELKSLCSWIKIQQCIQLTSVVKRNRLFDVLCFNFLCTKEAHNCRGPLHCYMCTWCIDWQSVRKISRFPVAKKKEKNPEIITAYSQLCWPTKQKLRDLLILFSNVLIRSTGSTCMKACTIPHPVLTAFVVFSSDMKLCKQIFTLMLLHLEVFHASTSPGET